MKPPIPALLQEQFDTAWEQFTEAAAEAGIPLPGHPEFLGVLRRVWACSLFVAQSCIRDPGLLDGLLQEGDLFIEYPPERYRVDIDGLLGSARDVRGLGNALRRMRQREMVRIAWRDLAGWSGLDETLRETSWLAEALIDGALRWLHERASRARGVPHGRNSDEPQTLVVLGMGKLGAFELNFSSDVDLIFVYGEDGETRGRRPRTGNEEYFTELGQALIATLNEPTEGGFVYRVDMRLRPYGQSGPLVMNIEQVEDYYQRQGREWERYAMIKARPVAGDRATGQRLIRMLHPFIYRRYLDFGVFESLREMKALIDREAGKKELEDNIKLGPGGIREIEFIGQTFQLIRGGREPELQAQGILLILARLAAAGHLPEDAARELSESYCFLRLIENRLQMYADQQTHQLPTDEAGRLRLAFSMGYDDWAGLLQTLESHRVRVRRHFDEIFAAPRRAGGTSSGDASVFPDFGALWRGMLPPEQARKALSDSGFRDVDESLRRLTVLRESYVNRALSTRGRERMDRLIPLLIEAVSTTVRPDVTLARVLNLIEQIARRTAYLALLAETPEVLSQMVRLCEASPWIAGMLREQPLLLDELIAPRSLYQPLERAALRRALTARLDAVGEDQEQQLEALRQFKQASILRVAAADVMGVMPLMVVSDHLTEIAEVVLTEVYDLATTYVSRRNKAAGTAIARGFAIIAYGKLAGIELGYGSDLDLVFLHAATESAAAAQVYPRLGQRIIHMLSAQTPSGILYEVDMRLRPSGAAGLLVSPIDAFEEYQRHQAWTWEHQALVRARVIVGSPEIAQGFEALRREVLARVREPEPLRAEIREMRERMRKELARGGPGRFDLKQDPGGIADIEFIVQYAVLRWAHRHPELLRWTDNIRLLQTLEQVGLLTGRQSGALIDSYRSYRTRVHRLALQEIENAVVDEHEFNEERAAITSLWQEIMQS